MRRLTLGRMPDPARAHGAWVYLIVSILAGALSEVREGFVPALLAGTSFAGVFLLGSAFAVPPARRRMRILLGVPLGLVAPAVALAIGADPTFLAYAAVAVFPAGLSAWLAERDGFLSPAALSAGVAALGLAAPAAACAGGADVPRTLVLAGLLVPWFLWRTVRLRKRLDAIQSEGRAGLRRAGLREAGLTVVWTTFAVIAIHLY